MEEKKGNFEDMPVKKIRLKTAIEAFLAIAFVFLFSMGCVAYLYNPSEDSLAGRILRVFSYPIVSVEGKNMIFSSDVRESLNVLRKYYESKEVSIAGERVDFSSEDDTPLFLA